MTKVWRNPNLNPQQFGEGAGIQSFSPKGVPTVRLPQQQWHEDPFLASIIHPESPEPTSTMVSYSGSNKGKSDDELRIMHDLRTRKAGHLRAQAILKGEDPDDIDPWDQR